MSDDAELRRQARKNLEARQGFWWFLVVFIVVNAFMVGIWYFTSSPGYFWPGWVLAGTGIALIFSGINAFTPFGGKITEAKVDAEMRRLRGE